MKTFFIFLFSLLLLAGCTAQSPKSVCCDECKQRELAPVDSFVSKNYFDDMYRYASMRYTFSPDKFSDFATWQESFRGELKQKLGITKLERELADFVPTAKQIDNEDLGYAFRQRWVIWTEPTVPLPVVILIPKEMTGRVPLMITPHGHGKNTESYAGVYHSEEERSSGEEGERNVAVQAVQNGFIAIAPTARGFGKTRTAKDLAADANNSCRVQLMHDLLVGRTPIGDRVWDISKIIDWATKNLPVDGSKIIVSGNSGGGTATLFAGACDTRITASMPASYFCTFTGSIGTLHHCDCNYVPGIMELGEMADVAGLTAPRFFCAINGMKDNIFPIEETRSAFAHLQTIYQASGASTNCELFEGNEGHRYYKKGAWDFLHKIGFKK